MTTILLETKDNARAQLSANILAAATSIPLASGQGALFPQPYTGNASSAGDSTTLNDTGDLGDLAIGDVIRNVTDGSWGVVTVAGTNSITTSELIGGNDNTWGNGDEWRVNEFVVTSTNETVDANGEITVVKQEKILIKERNTDTLIVDDSGRGYDGSTAQDFSTNDYINLYVTTVVNEGIKDALADIISKVSSNNTSVTSDVTDLKSSQPMHGTDSGAANAYVVSVDSDIDAYIEGLRISFVPDNDCTGASTINVNSLGVKDIKKYHDDDVATGDIRAGAVCTLVYNGVEFELQEVATQPTAGITVTTKVFSFTRNMNTATGTETIAHGMGVTPSYITIIGSTKYSFGGYNTYHFISDGFSNGTDDGCNWTGTSGTISTSYPAPANGVSTSACVYMRTETGNVGPDYNIQSATASLDSTNIELDFTLTTDGLPTNLLASYLVVAYYIG